MSKYEAYLKKLDLNIQSFELEYNNKIESTRYYYEDIIKKTRLYMDSKVFC
jgi:sulfur carrier protein ThiS